MFLLESGDWVQPVLSGRLLHRRTNTRGWGSPGTASEAASYTRILEIIFCRFVNTVFIKSSRCQPSGCRQTSTVPSPRTVLLTEFNSFLLLTLGFAPLEVLGGNFSCIYDPLMGFCLCILPIFLLDSGPWPILLIYELSSLHSQILIVYMWCKYVLSFWNSTKQWCYWVKHWNYFGGYEIF